MARRELEDRNTRKIFRTGAGESYAVTLPIEFIRELGWQDRQRVVVKKEGKRLIIEDWNE